MRDVLAGHQALCAEDPFIRKAMRVIAEEETDHAALSWDLARWLDRHLSEEQRAAVRETRAAAVRELADEVSRPVDPHIVASAGVPSTAVSVRLLDEAAHRLLAA